MRRAGHVARMGEMRNSYRILVGRLEGKNPLQKPRCRWRKNTRIVTIFSGILAFLCALMACLSKHSSL